MRRNRETRFPAVFGFDNSGKVFHWYPMTAKLQHSSRQCPDHPPQKPICLHPVNQAITFPVPFTMHYLANKGFHLRVALGKRGKILVTLYPLSRLLHDLQVELIGKIKSPFPQKRILFLVYIIPVFPARGIEPAMSRWLNLSNRMNNNVLWQNGVDLV